MKVFVILCAIVCQCLAKTTIELLAEDPKMSTLVGLVTKAGLVNAINSGTFTIFAPNDDAFAALSTTTLNALADDVTALTNVLKYHVVQGSIPSSAAKNELQLVTLNTQKVRFNIYSHNHVVTIEGSKIIEFDRTASNGVIHVLESVMMPPEGDIVDIVAGIANVLKGDALTVFAPTNDAFSRLPQSLQHRITTDKNLLTEILEYHVVPHTEYSAGLYNREYVRTLDRHHDILAIHTSSGGVRLNQNSHVIKADIGTTNGVIHLIDHVLIPARYYLTLILGRK